MFSFCAILACDLWDIAYPYRPARFCMLNTGLHSFAYGWWLAWICQVHDGQGTPYGLSYSQLGLGNPARIQGIAAQGDLYAIVEAVTVRVRIERIGAEGEFLGDREAIAVGVRIGIRNRLQGVA